MARLRALPLRRLLALLRVGDDTVRQLSTFQRLGATVDAAPLREGLPVAARTALRSVRTRSAADVRPDWVWPHWLEQQLDPTSPAFVARGHLPTMQNVTARNWTAIGNPWSADEAIVDPVGLVTPGQDRWSLDWWVRGPDGWHVPSREGALQRLVDATPVVETAVPQPSGDVAHRAYAVETVPELVVVDVQNRTSEHVRVALAVRPYNPEGLAVIERVALVGTALHVEGEPVVHLPATPATWHVSTYREGDSAHALLADEPSHQRLTADDPAGLAQCAVGYDLAPGERLRVALPIGGDSTTRRFPAPWRRRMRDTVPAPDALAEADEVAAAWRHRLDRGLRVDLPDARLQAAVDANRAFLLLMHDPGSVTAGPVTYHRFWFRDAAYQIAALDRWGFHDEAADVLSSYPGRQRADGVFHSQWREWDANGAALWTIAEHHRLTGDEELLGDLVDAAERGARWIAGTCGDDRGKIPEAGGLLPAGVSAEHFGPFDYYYWDDLWAWRGLLDAAALVRHVGRVGPAVAFDVAAARLRLALERSWRRDADRLGQPVIPAGPTRGLDAGMAGPLAATYPLGLLAPDDPRIRATLSYLRERFTIGDAFYQAISHTGLGTYLTLQLAAVELLGGDPRGWTRVRWLLGAASPTFTWPEAIHPQLLGGCMGDGHHGWMAADLLNVVRLTLVRETDTGLALLSHLPDEWRGEPLRVEDAPTHHGNISYELRWDGDDAVLSWELEGASVPLFAPGSIPRGARASPRGRRRSHRADGDSPRVTAHAPSQGDATRTTPRCPTRCAASRPWRARPATGSWPSPPWGGAPSRRRRRSPPVRPARRRGR